MIIVMGLGSNGSAEQSPPLAAAASSARLSAALAIKGSVPLPRLLAPGRLRARPAASTPSPCPPSCVCTCTRVHSPPGHAPGLPWRGCAHTGVHHASRHVCVCVCAWFPRTCARLPRCARTRVCACLPSVRAWCGCCFSRACARVWRSLVWLHVCVHAPRHVRMHVHGPLWLECTHTCTPSCVHAHTHVHSFLCVCTITHAPLSVCMHTHTDVHAVLLACAQMCTPFCMHARSHVHPFLHACTQTCTSSCLHAHMHPFLCACTNTCAPLSACTIRHVHPCLCACTITRTPLPVCMHT